MLDVASTQLGLEATMSAILVAIVFHLIHIMFGNYFPQEVRSCRGLITQVILSVVIAYLAAEAFGASERVCGNRYVVA